jgi:hypothetical protein
MPSVNILVPQGPFQENLRGRKLFKNRVQFSLMLAGTYIFMVLFNRRSANHEKVIGYFNVPAHALFGPNVKEG